MDLINVILKVTSRHTSCRISFMQLTSPCTSYIYMAFIAQQHSNEVYAPAKLIWWSCIRNVQIVFLHQQKFTWVFMHQLIHTVVTCSSLFIIRIHHDLKKEKGSLAYISFCVQDPGYGDLRKLYGRVFWKPC